MSNVLAHTLSLIALATAAIGCSEDPEPEPTPSRIFVGEIAASSTSVAVIAGAEGTAAVYLCDGIQASTWFFGTISGGVIAAESDDGGMLQATVAGEQVTGSFTLPSQAAVDFSAARAGGVAGIFLVDQAADSAEGFSATGAHLQATLSAGAVSGTIEPVDGEPIALQGTLRSFGEPTGVATWIVQADGSVKGKIANTTGGGNCSTWAKIKQIAFGVDCTFF